MIALQSPSAELIETLLFAAIVIGGILVAIIRAVLRAVSGPAPPRRPPPPLVGAPTWRDLMEGRLPAAPPTPLPAPAESARPTAAAAPEREEAILLDSGPSVERSLEDELLDEEASASEAFGERPTWVTDPHAFLEEARSPIPPMFADVESGPRAVVPASEEWYHDRGEWKRAILAVEILGAPLAMRAAWRNPR